ncbi:MAG: UDP-N-acetylmuramoyl-tripeptide--D-alanyl-D-alanine ligase [Verrucomicrobiota bacterium]
MKPVSLSEVAGWVDGALIQGVPKATVSRVSTDSRSCSTTDIFVALKGERFDGHDFLADVVGGGAAGVIVSSLPASLSDFEGGVVLVNDTLEALQQIAFHYRRSLDDFTVVGVTGSNGKTSTKDFLKAVLGGGTEVSATAGNLNNHIGLPLTALSAESGHRYGVWEMGMNHPGEIEVLAEIAGPNIGVITNIGTAHIEHMKTRAAIADEKAELIRSLPTDGLCVLPAGDDYYPYLVDQASCKVLSGGIDQGQVRAERVSTKDDGTMDFLLVSEFADATQMNLPVRGAHMVTNAVLAAAVGLSEGFSAQDIAERLSKIELTGGRLQERLVGGYRFLDDSYNANPESMLAAIDVLSTSAKTGRTFAVLGFMGELGDTEDEAYRSLGEALDKKGIDALVTLGDRAAMINEAAGAISVNENFDSHREVAAFLSKNLTGSDCALLKGSRAARMEKVIEELSH